MKEEDKQLLLEDLCGRLPYGVKVQYKDKIHDIDHISSIYEEVKLDIVDNYTISILEVKPYLLPLSSMTEEQKEDLLLTVVGKEGLKLFSVTKDGIISNDKAEQSFKNFSINSINFSNKNIEAYIDWLNKNHFDYRGLIPKGSAIDATGLNIY